jgi:hypothetical protein
MKGTILRDVGPYSLVDVHRRFRGTSKSKPSNQQAEMRVMLGLHFNRGTGHYRMLRHHISEYGTL